MLTSRATALGLLVVLVALALVIPGRVAFFLLPPLALLPRFVGHLRAGWLGAAARDSLLWALALSILTIACVALFPEHTATRIARGVEYRDEMFRWITTGVGKEGEIRQFLPEHLTHLALLLLLSFATGGIAALYLGGFLLGYMNFYVGSLIAASHMPAYAAAVGWPVWSICRVAGFVLAAIAVARPFYARFRHTRPDLTSGIPLLIAGLSLAAADILLKLTLAETWRSFLSSALLG
jgi:hypothetical protein